jgi:5-methylthioadenosine/S-adenosylhomocysteine deaminase
VAVTIDGRNDPYVLEGRVVTMDAARTVIDRGAIYVQAGVIAAVQEVQAPVPPGFEDAPRVRTGDTFYPGMIELHNHLAYNAVPLWRVPKTYAHNGSWRGTDEATRAVGKSAEVLARSPGVVEALVRYAECRCLMGGVTTSQGITLATRPGVEAYFKGFVRNVEQSSVDGLPSADTRIANPDTDGATAYLERLQAVSCRLQHLSEGIGDTPRGWFLRLRLPDGGWAINDAFCGIHATALTADDFDVVHSNGGSVVWSPLSNYLLYGATADLRALKRSGVLIGLGSDWAPSGSKNLLGELKVARLASEAAADGVGDGAAGGAVFTPAELVAMATINPAMICKWSTLLGSIEAAKLADLIAVNGTGGDPYEHLLDARETSITLVVVDGIPRVGQRSLMDRFAGDHERVMLGRSDRLLDLTTADGADPLGGITLTDSKARLREALDDLPGLADALDRGVLAEGFPAALRDVAGPSAAPAGAAADGFPDTEPTRWVVKLDFADDLSEFGSAHGLMDVGRLADWVEPMVFEDLSVADDPGFLSAIVQARNVPRFVKVGLPRAYGRTLRVPEDTPT